MNYLNYLKDSWQILENTPLSPGDYRVREVPEIQFPAGHLLFAVDEHRYRHVLIPVPAGFKVEEDRISSGVQIVSHNLVDGKRLKSFLDLVCLKPHLHELFSIVGSEMLEQLVVDSSRPDRVCQQVLSRWRDLLAAVPSARPSMETLVGLYGELWYLREFIRLNAAVLDCWSGPSRSRHDFVKNTTALEVKTTRSRQGRFVEIHGHTQLEPPIDGQLYLAILKLEETTGNGEALNSLVESIIALGADRATLLTRLNTAGLNPLDLATYSEPVFQILENRIYQVEAGFPRITAASFLEGKLPAGILKLDYQLDLTGEPPFPLSLEAVRILYHFFAGVTNHATA